MGATSVFDHIPHTLTELARGGIGLGLGAAISIISGLLIYLLNAPIWFVSILALVFSLGIILAIGAPIWYWLIRPLRR